MGLNLNSPKHKPAGVKQCRYSQRLSGGFVLFSDLSAKICPSQSRNPQIFSKTSKKSLNLQLKRGLGGRLQELNKLALHATRI